MTTPPSRYLNIHGYIYNINIWEVVGMMSKAEKESVHFEKWKCTYVYV